ncbi:MAG: hypothetical protein KDC24_08875 [Saprospiraceae bacterium]|nr:hypothetical protein [Saprospiraceae bacterium]
MMNYKNIFFLLVTTIFLSACQGDKDPYVKNMVEKLTNDKIILASGEEITIPPNGGDKTVLFIVCSGEFDLNPDAEIMDQKLNDNGVNLATMLSGFFKDVKVDGGVLAAMHPVANQFGQIIAEPNGWTTFNYNTIDYGAFLDYIYDMKKGDRFIVVEDPRTMSKLLNTLSGSSYPELESTPNFGTRKIWYVETSRRTDVNIRELRF